MMQSRSTSTISSLAFWATSTGMLILAIWACVLATTWLNRPFPGFVVLRNAHVDSLASARWTGFQHGIRQVDHVLAVNGTPVRDGPDLYRQVAARPVGTELTYLVQRKEGDHFRTLTLKIPTQRFNWFDFIGYFLAFWVVGFAHLLIGIFVTVVKPGDPVARAHYLFCLFFGTFFITNFDGITTQVFTYFPHNWSFAVLGAFAINLAALIPRPVPVFRRHAWLRALVVIAGFAFGGYVAWSFDRPDQWPRGFGLLTAFSSVATLIIPASAVWARWSRTSSLQVKKQAGTILWGALIAFVGPITINSLGMGGITVPGGEMTFFTFVVFPATVAYTIVRHQLFDIDVIIKRTVTYALATTATMALYFLFTAGFRSLFGTGTGLTNVVATGAVAVMFAPLRDRSQALVDRVFFRSSYDLARLLTDFGDRARGTFDPQQLLGIFLHTLDAALAPTYLAVLLPDEQGALVMRQGLGLEPGSGLVLRPELPGLKDILGPGGELNVEPLDLPGCPGATLSPLRLKDELVGVVVVGPRKSDQIYTSGDRNLLVNLSQQLALWVKNAQLFGQLAGQERMKRELEIAHEVQTGLLPAILPQSHGLEFSATSVPALEVGGDFYDVIPIDEHRVGIVIGDVSGKGVPAALLMAMTMVIFRSIARDNPSAADVMAQANALIFSNRPSRKMFVTAFYAVYDSRDRSLRYANAGNPLPIGSAGRLEAKGVSLGMFPTASYDEKMATLSPGELVVMYSDGLEDALDGSGHEQFGEERLAGVIFENLKATPSELQERILGEIHRFSGEAAQFDDITLIALRAH